MHSAIASRYAGLAMLSRPAGLSRHRRSAFLAPHFGSAGTSPTAYAVPHAFIILYHLHKPRRAAADMPILRTLPIISFGRIDIYY